MFDEYEHYQGLILRQIITEAENDIRISPVRKVGRINSFVINGAVGIFVKHSAKRLSPWQFTFHREHFEELAQLETDFRQVFMALVCGNDGSVAVRTDSLRELVDFNKATQWVRAKRSRRSMYGLSGSKGDLRNKIAQGVTPIFIALAEMAMNSTKRK